MTKNYFSHSTIIGLWLLLILMIAVCAQLGLCQKYALWGLLPILIAPFYEWVMHKYVLHDQLPKQDCLRRRMMIRLHHGHHREPQNYQLLFAPVWAVAIHLIATYLLFTLLTLSFTIALIPFTIGIAYYLLYEWIHLAHHTPKHQPRTRWGYRLKRAHMWHHHHNENYYWGITNAFGDKILGTFKDKSIIPKSNTTKNISGYTD